MDSLMEDVVTPMLDCGSSSGEASETDDEAHIPSVGVDAPVQESSAISPPVDSVDPLEESIIIHARAYQIEMFEKSLKQNIIVAVGQVSSMSTTEFLSDVRVADGHGKW
ncbi:hypothetical protein ONZ43_g4 [Nemania bipapillata]|uniref:Uncharacterized protein n=1 Tax=Nemania bipapillata TaxID=110536 RepID=A0ACC2JA60_9PEZI|nr:hypothetical protein ONZ43_g4 [Nemania bipapillata]